MSHHSTKHQILNYIWNQFLLSKDDNGNLSLSCFKIKWVTLNNTLNNTCTHMEQSLARVNTQKIMIIVPVLIVYVITIITFLSLVY